jgi:predicted nucleic acid-binding protein
LIVVDTTVLVYAVGERHRLKEPCQLLVDAIGQGRLSVTTTSEVIQEFVHVRARRRGRQDAAFWGREYATLFSPLLPLTETDLMSGLRLFETFEGLGSFDAVLAAAMERNAHSLISADSAFAAIPGLAFIDPGTPEMEQLLSR